LSLYKEFRERYNRIHDFFYFKVKKRLKRSTLFTARNILVAMTVAVVLILFSGGLVALTDPAVGALFVRGTSSQSMGETFLFFFLNTLSLIGLILIERGARKRIPEFTSLILGFILFFAILLANWYIMCQFKMVCP